MSTKTAAVAEIGRREHNRPLKSMTKRQKLASSIKFISHDSEKYLEDNGLTLVESVALYHTSGAVLEAMAGTTKAPKAPKAPTKVKTTEASEPVKVDGRVIVMDDAKKALRDLLYANIKAGNPEVELVKNEETGEITERALSYQESCFDHGIPTRKLLKHGVVFD